MHAGLVVAALAMLATLIAVPAMSQAEAQEGDTRNTIFDDNEFKNVPMDDIQVSDLTINADLYNEGLLDTTNSGYFRVKCEFSHFAYDDPIIFPGEPGRAHLHMFFGNTQTNAYSTFDSLLNTGTGTCNGEDLNRTAYWIPAMLDSAGNAIIPFELMVYYKNDNFRLNGANELVNPFPDNLQMVVGQAMGEEPQTELSGDWGQPIIRFACGPAYRSEGSYGPLIPDCQGTGAGPYNGRALEMQISFPQCYNPDADTYVPGGSHMSYSENGYYGVACPDSHPYDISSIMYRVFFSPDDYGGSLNDLRLSSDVKPDGRIMPGGTTAHADWFGAWNRDAMDLWVDNCNNTQADCEIGLLGRDPFISLKPRKENGVDSGDLFSPQELMKLCPSKTFDPSDPVRSVALCKTMTMMDPEPTATVAPTSTTVPTAEPTATVAPTSTTVPTVAPTATVAPTSTTVPTAEPTATVAPTSTTVPTVAPTSTVAPIPDPTAPPTPTPEPDGEPDEPIGSCSARARVRASWRSGYVAQIIVTNTGQTPINGWEVEWDFTSGERVANAWGLDLTGDSAGSSVSWNGSLRPKRRSQAGFVALLDRGGRRAAPENFTCTPR